MNFEEVKSEVEKVEEFLDKHLDNYQSESLFYPEMTIVYHRYYGFSVKLNESVLWSEENDSLSYWTWDIYGEDVEAEMPLSDFLIRKITTYYSFGNRLFK